ncbi:PREDICTED: histone-lysine N-methyltransferase SETMAR-like [Acromyrmex echinatior]|uniref:histone-lysine N-methyltransferase SETMAR-like n=1 Tax=Acromyrmex echinatior TaxID=103372 RepID=UPI00058104DA|nr:PREDICTED: histone-lysine N-methyltransferase SETMAR-like [Acromyrmex echinatior]
MDTSKEKIRHILQFFFDKGENASQAENVNSVYDSDTVTANHAQFWFRRFRSGNFDVKDVSRSGRPIVENVDKIMEIVESDRHVSTVSIAQELNIAQKTVWNHLNKAGYKKKLDVWVPYELTQKNLMYRISICESLLNRNKINLFLKRMMTGDEKKMSLVALLVCLIERQDMFLKDVCPKLLSPIDGISSKRNKE